jgi:hypothetical protein
LNEESIAFDPIELRASEPGIVNFMEHGSSHLERIDLAVVEFDAGLLTNLNFRNPDSFKINIITAGLEEVRGIL